MFGRCLVHASSSGSNFTGHLQTFFLSCSTSSVTNGQGSEALTLSKTLFLNWAQGVSGLDSCCRDFYVGGQAQHCGGISMKDIDLKLLGIQTCFRVGARICGDPRPERLPSQCLRDPTETRKTQDRSTNQQARAHHHFFQSCNPLLAKGMDKFLIRLNIRSIRTWVKHSIGALELD